MNHDLTQDEIQRLGPILGFGEEVREAIRQRIDTVAGLAQSQEVEQQHLFTWRIALMVTAWDVSDSVFDLARTGKNHIRAIKMMNRSLFEYSIRLEYYAHEPQDAVKHGKNLSNWFRVLTNATVTVAMKPEELSKRERKWYSDLMKSTTDELDYGDVPLMLKRVLKARGTTGGDLKRAVKWIMGNYYLQASAYIHGSQGNFLSIFESENGLTDYRLKTDRFDTVASVKEAVHHLIATLQAEATHAKTDVGSASFFDRFDAELGGLE